METQEDLSPTAVIAIAERRKRRMDQGEFADLISRSSGDAGWKQPRVARLEGDRLKITVEVLQALSKALDVDYTTLIEGHPQHGRQGVTPRLPMDGETAGQTVDAQDSLLAMAA